MEEEKIKKLCRKYNIYPSKKKGQNFLISESVLEAVVEAADLSAKDCVVEVGPGLGVLTKALARKAHKVVSVELDHNAYAAGKEILSDCKNVELINSDILKISNFKLLEYLNGDKYKMVSNLPYNITSAILKKFTSVHPQPELIVVMVQKEVAQRVCAKPGDMSILSVAIQYYGKPEIVEVVSSGAFWPRPEIESAILKIKITKHPKDFDKKFFQIARIGFSSRRKQLQNNLCSGLRVPRERVMGILNKLGLKPMVRAQELSVDHWIKLAMEIIVMI